MYLLCWRVLRTAINSRIERGACKDNTRKDQGIQCSIQNLIPKSQIISIQPGTIVALVFDTDVHQTANLKKNIELLNRYCGKIRIIYLPQVMNLEDELRRCTDIKSVSELTQSNGIRNFKTDFCRLKVKDCRTMLDRHKLDYKSLWATKIPEEYNFVKSNSCQVKT